MHRQWFRSFSVLVLALSVLVGFPTLARAQACDQTIDDQANLFGSRLSDVQAAADKLAGTGADVRVVTVSSLGSHGNLDLLKKARQNDCPSWQSPNGKMKNNLIVLIIAMQERKAGIYCGDTYLPRLSEDLMGRIRVERMTPKFRSGDFAGGFIDAMAAIGDVITITPVAPAPVVVTVPRDAGPPPDLSGFWRVLGWLVGLGFVTFLLIYGLRIARSRREERERRRAAQLIAQRSRQACADVINELDDTTGRLTMLSVKLNGLAKRTSAESLRPWRTKVEQIVSRADTLKGRFSGGQNTANDPSTDGRSVDEYEAITGFYEPLGRDLAQLHDDLNRLNEQVDELRTQIDGATAGLTDATTILARATTHIDHIASRRFRVEEALSLLSKVKTALDDGRRMLEAQDALGALAMFEQVRTLATQAEDEATKQVRSKVDLDNGVLEITARCAAVESTIANGRTVFEAIAANYAPACWTTIQGNGSEAEKRLTTARAMIAPITAAASMDQQQWRQAEKLLAAANGILDEADSHIRSITELGQNLEHAKTDAPRELELAAADLAKATEYEAQYDIDITDEVKPRLEAARTMLVEARTELAKPQPDYLSALRLVRKAHQAADTIMDEQRDEHEAAERLRQKAASRLRDATASVSKAKEYIEDHQRDTKATAETLLQNAQANLAIAGSATDPKAVVMAAESAISQAEDALGKAKADHRRAESRRAEARRQRDDDDSTGAFVGGAVVGSILGSSSGSHHHHDYGGWGSSGGGSDGGGSSGGFDFGGGGGDGGGSSGGW